MSQLPDADYRAGQRGLEQSWAAPGKAGWRPTTAPS